MSGFTMQSLIDAIGNAAQQTRSDYHVTLGELTEMLEANPGSLVRVNGSRGLDATSEHSYRGYYDDLAFEESDEPAASGAVLAACERAASDVYQGYKGGDFRYGPETPLWLASYGNCGEAIVSASVQDGIICLNTKKI